MTLLIVDMQEYFEASKPIVENVIREVRRAKRSNTGIIVAEYDPEQLGSSWLCIRKELRGYSRKRFVAKYNDDGGCEVVRSARQAKFNLSSWRVCGVNTCFCVFDTTKTIEWLLPKASFSFVKTALNCNCYNKNCVELTWNHSKHKKVSVV